MFIPNFLGLVKPITLMLKKDATFKWTMEGKDRFENIKQEITHAPTLINPDYTMDLSLYAHGAESSIAMVTQLNDQEMEHHVAFFSPTHKNYKLKYNHI